MFAHKYPAQSAVIIPFFILSYERGKQQDQPVEKLQNNDNFSLAGTG